MIPQSPISTLFPYTTLFRSGGLDTGDERCRERRLDFAIARGPARRHEPLGSPCLLLSSLRAGARHPVPAGALGFIECGIRPPDNRLRGIVLRGIFDN